MTKKPSQKKTSRQSLSIQKPAARMRNIERSATIQLAERAKELSRQGRKIISLSLGEPDFDTPAHIRTAAKKALDRGKTHYTPAPGIPELREAVALHCKKNNGIPCDPGDVIITPTKLGIFNSILTMVGRGDEIIIPEPAWVTYRPTVQIAQGRPVSLKLTPENDFRLLPENLAEGITKKTKMVILNTPCNPTGGVYRKSDIKGIAELAVDHDFLVLTDETYEKIIYEGRHYSIASMPNMFQRTITVSGLSKTYAMTGWRIGWIVAAPNILNEIKKVHEHSLTCATSFAQYGAVTALSGPQKCVTDMVSEFRARRDLVVKGINDIDGLHCNNPKGAFYVFFSYDYDMTSDDLATYLLESAGVALTPGSGFGAPGEGYLRMSYATSQEVLKDGLGKIKNALENNKKLRKRGKRKEK